MHRHIAKIRAAAIGVAVLSGGAAVAGNLETAPAPAPAPVVITPTFGDWTGPYAGIQIGIGDVDTNVGANGDGELVGVHGGYRYDFGTFVLGGELDYDDANIDLTGGATVDSVARLKMNAGYDFGRTLGYFTAGFAHVDTSLGSENGEFIGVGVAHQATQNIQLGAELLEHRFDDVNGSGVDADATTVNLRMSFSF